MCTSQKLLQVMDHKNKLKAEVKCVNLYKTCIVLLYCILLSTPCISNDFIFYFLFLSFGFPVPVPQAIADPEPADLDRVQCGSVPVILSAAL